MLVFRWGPSQHGHVCQSSMDGSTGEFWVCSVVVIVLDSKVKSVVVVLVVVLLLSTSSSGSIVVLACGGSCSVTTGLLNP